MVPGDILNTLEIQYFEWLFPLRQTFQVETKGGKLLLYLYATFSLQNTFRILLKVVYIDRLSKPDNVVTLQMPAVILPWCSQLSLYSRNTPRFSQERLQVSQGREFSNYRFCHPLSSPRCSKPHQLLFATKSHFGLSVSSPDVTWATLLSFWQPSETSSSRSTSELASFVLFDQHCVRRPCINLVYIAYIVFFLYSLPLQPSYITFHSSFETFPRFPSTKKQFTMCLEEVMVY